MLSVITLIGLACELEVSGTDTSIGLLSIDSELEIKSNWLVLEGNLAVVDVGRVVEIGFGVVEVDEGPDGLIVKSA